jgi:hypothetical protein
LIDQLRREREIPKIERETLERSITSALRSAIHDRGTITAATIGSAVKRGRGELEESGGRVAARDQAVRSSLRHQRRAAIVWEPVKKCTCVVRAHTI